MATRKATEPVLSNKTCKEMANLVYNYLNESLNPRVKKDFEQHLRVCPDCVNFLNTYKKTVEVTQTVRAEEIPANVRKNIIAFLRKRIRRVGTYILIVAAHVVTEPGSLIDLCARCIDFALPSV